MKNLEFCCRTKAKLEPFSELCLIVGPSTFVVICRLGVKTIYFKYISIKSRFKSYVEILTWHLFSLSDIVN